MQLRAIPDYETDIASMNRIDRFDWIVEFHSKNVCVKKSDKIGQFVVKLLLKLDEKILKKDSKE